MALPNPRDRGDLLPPRSVARDTGSTLAASATVLICVAAANILIGRLLGVRGQGQVAAATLVPMIVAYSGELGIPIASGYLINADPGHRNIIIANARVICAILTLGLTAVSAVLILLLPLPAEAKPLSWTFCVFIALSLFYRLHLTVLQAEARMRPFNIIRVIGAATYVGLLLLYAATRTASPFAVIVALLLANLVWCLTATWCAASRPTWTLAAEQVRALFRYGLPAHVGNVSSVDGLKLDQLVLALFLSTRQLGLYVAAMTIIVGNRVIGTSIGMVCFPLASRGEGSRGLKAQRHFEQLLMLTLGAAFAVAVFELLFSTGLLTLLFGKEFAPAAPALRVLAVGSVAMNVRQTCAEWLRGCGKPQVVAKAEALGIASLLILSGLTWDGSILRVAWIVAFSSVISLVALPRSVIATLRTRPGDIPQL